MVNTEDPISASDDDQAVMEGNEELGSNKETNFMVKASHDAKLKELLHKINSFEIKLCSDATKEFIKLLKGSNSGGELLHSYVNSTSNFSELFSALKLREGKPGSHYLLKLISVILGHPDGKFVPNDKGRIGVSAVLDKFAKSFVEEKLDFIHKELVSKDKKRQNAALLVMSSVVRRGSGLASEVAKKFDFKLKGFSKLSEYELRKNDNKRKKSTNDGIRKYITRKSFVGFAMSFLEVGKPGLLRWVLQQREVYSGVLRVLGNDDDETVMYVLSILRDRVLTEDSLVLPSLRSVLFGSVVLEQLADIAIKRYGGDTAELAHNVLHMVCTDPCNGLMPDLRRHPNPLKGNPKRLLQLMKSLKATELDGRHHQELLLAIAKGSPSLAAAYLEEFPYNLDDYASPSWLSTVSLAANLVSLVIVDAPFGFLDSQSDDPPSFDSVGLQNIKKIISSRSLSRSVINKGLLHSDFLVKNGTLRLLLETLRLFDSFFRAINLSRDKEQMMPKWAAFKQELRNEIQTFLPDPQIFLSLLSSLSSPAKASDSCLKRKADKETCLVPCKKRKTLKKTIMNEDADIIIGGITSALDSACAMDGENVVDSQMPHALDSEMDFITGLSELWNFDQCFGSVSTRKDAEIFFHSKVLDAVKVYILIMPTALEGSFEFFMNLLGNPSELPSNLLFSLLSLLVEYIRSHPGSGISIKTPQMMYKHLQPFLNLLLFSPVVDINDQAFTLARAAMYSTGAFDRNLNEIVAWFLFLPGYGTVKSSFEIHREVMQSLSAVVISFLCDAISTIGNNLFKYWHAFRNHIHRLKEFTDISPDFSPFIICVLQKCIRLLSSDSGTFSIPEKTMISTYVCNTLKYLLQTQVDARLLAALIKSLLSEGLQDRHSLDSLCEWLPLKSLMLLAENILHQNACCSFPIIHKDFPVDICFLKALGEIRKIIESEDGCSETSGIVRAFYSSIVCTTPDAVLKDLPTVMTISQHIRAPLSFLSSIIFLDQSFLAGVMKLWPKIFLSGLEKAVSTFDPQDKENDAYTREILLNVDFDATEAAAAVAFGLFLRQAPFHVIFQIIISNYGPCISESSMIKDLLMDKISECTSDVVVSYLRLLLFWFYQIQLSYRIKPSAKLKESTEICFNLLKHLLSRLLVLKPDSRDPLSAELFHEVVKTIFSHPGVETSLSYPLGCEDNSNEDFMEGNFKGNLEAFFVFSQRQVHPIDHHVLDILTTTFDYFLNPSCGQHYVLKFEDGRGKQLVKAIKTLMQNLHLELKDKLDLCIRTNDLSPILQPFYALHALTHFTSPFELFELAHWIFDRVQVNGLPVLQSCSTSALAIGFCIASDAFKILSSYLQQPIRSKALFYTFWAMGEKNLDLIEDIYVKLCKYAIDSRLDFAYSCLLEAVTAVYKLKCIKSDLLDPLSLVMSSAIRSTPIEMVSHCIYGTSKTKAKLLFLLVEINPPHLSVLGYLFSGIVSKNDQINRKMVEETSNMSLSDEDCTLLLPAVLSYLNSVFTKLEKQRHKQFTEMPSFYAKILLRGFQNWKSFVSGLVFQEHYDECLPSSIKELVNLVNNSLLGKAMHMLQYHFSLNGEMEMEERLKMFSCVVTSSDGYDHLLDCDIDEIEIFSCSQLLNLINRVAAKIKFCRMLLFPDDDQIWPLVQEADKPKATEMVSSKEDRSRMRLIQTLVRTWQCIVKKYPVVSECSIKEKSSGCLQLYRYLELFILKIIHELTCEMRDGLIQLQAIPFLEQLMRASLLYRFEDPTTLNVLRSILTLLSEGKFSSVLYLQLLLAHSQFASTIQSLTVLQTSHDAAFIRPMSSILRSLVFPHLISKNHLKSTKPYLKQLEIVKLLRLFIQMKPDQIGCYSGQDIGINLKDLYLLLLSSYGATLCEMDLEIFGLMRAIESIDDSVSKDLAERDYLWGNASLRIRKERNLDWDTSSISIDTEVLEERRRNQFREILPIDPKMCMNTIVSFPYDRILSIGPEDPKNMQVEMVHFPGAEQSQQYDPIFILNFSNHNLSMGHIEPLEFACLGLLAVAFISMSSFDIEIRKLGDACLAKFKDALEICQKKKDSMRLHLLLTYMQNGIKEQFQRIPSVIALFAAESSFILLNPSNDLFTTLSNHLMHSRMVDMKHIPLFHSLVKSNSVNFRAERLWMLRLACAGLNLDDDAQIFISNSIPKTLLSFYATPFADDESKELILQFVKKSTKLDRMTRHLVESCGLFPWLSSVISVSSAILDESDKSFASLQFVLAVEVAFAIITSRDIVESVWFEKYAFEQCMELTSHLHKVLVGGSELIKKNVDLSEPILQIIISTLGISQKREICQPHFTLSFEGLFGIYQTCSAICTSRWGLEAILNSTPPVGIFHTNQEKLSGFLMWAVATALKSDSEKIGDIKESQFNLMIFSEKASYEESLISKLLRWLVASVIVGKLSWKLNDVDAKISEKSSPETLHSFLDYVEERCEGSKNYEFDCEEILAATIFYLQQMVGLTCTVPSSIVSALCILLHCGPSKCSDFEHDCGIDIVSLWLKIRCPIEANPEWRWFFDKPWGDLNLRMSNLQQMDEHQACQTLMVIISNILGKKPVDSQVLSFQKLVNFDWERTIIETNDNGGT
ncbi:uncharacterized protein LOC126667967 [Mercurialis annua]|uniref:uncharacterized protein LOC126667967 n=1 Tax=Mercurialis annua TaxID=3986 RepID=UPI00215E0F1C|nr:uncharacterized protein LOC126667967 [Mercurialis annua]